MIFLKPKNFTNYKSCKKYINVRTKVLKFFARIETSLFKSNDGASQLHSKMYNVYSLDTRKVKNNTRVQGQHSYNIVSLSTYIRPLLNTYFSQMVGDSYNHFSLFSSPRIFTHPQKTFLPLVHTSVTRPTYDFTCNSVLNNIIIQSIARRGRKISSGNPHYVCPQLLGEKVAYIPIL